MEPKNGFIEFYHMPNQNKIPGISFDDFFDSYYKLLLEDEIFEDISNKYLSKLLERIKPNDVEYKKILNKANDLNKEFQSIFKEIDGYRSVQLFGSVHKRTLLKSEIKKADFDFLIVFDFCEIEIVYSKCLSLLEGMALGTVSGNGSTIVILNGDQIEIVPAIIIENRIKVKCSDDWFGYNIKMYEYFGKMYTIDPIRELNALNSYKNLRELIVLGKYWQHIHQICFDSYRLESLIAEIVSGRKGNLDYKAKDRIYSFKELDRYFGEFPSLSFIIPLLYIFIENLDAQLFKDQNINLIIEAIINCLNSPSEKSLSAIFANNNGIQHFL